MLSDSVMRHKTSVKILPHIIDTILLGSALMMLYVFEWSVKDNNWLQVKIVALLIYIGLGWLALNPRLAKNLRAAAWLSAIVVFVFIVSVALTKSALGFTALIF